MLGQNFQLIIDPDATLINQSFQVSKNISLKAIRLPILIDRVGFGVDCEQHIKHSSLFLYLRIL
jgi:hypothetical protein